MNKQEYLEYEFAFADFIEKNNFEIIAAIDDKEPFFSRQPCEVCNSPLGGDREVFVGVDRKTNKTSEQFLVCNDCVYYNEYHKLDALTMILMED